MTHDDKPGLQVATLGGGCFWCLEAVFAALRGVEKVAPGYAGGTLPNPSYRQVCSGETGHAEVVQIHFDLAQISFEELLEVFFAIHDPTTPNRQGNDIGTQYRSVIFYHTPHQQSAAQAHIAALEGERTWPARIVTQVVPYQGFFHADDDHLAYYARNPEQPYCRAIISPKLAKLHKFYATRLKSSAA
ncbi:MAG: peptide-methionine (S)-S-oxide reductase MsrA [Sulfuricella sp.]|nr:peptide-methionine (S)-S-oxide reductase MsrA [Sulfuricella sp.]